MWELEAFKKLVPKAQRSLITGNLLDKIAGSIKDPMVAETFKEGFVSWSSVLKNGKYSMSDYLNAVKYVSYKLLNMTNTDAYIAAFPERYERIKHKGSDAVATYASMYNKNKLVNSIYEQTIVPSYIINAPMHQEALNTLARMMMDPDVRGMVKVKACEAILANTKAPEIIKNELVIGVDQQQTISDLREVTEQLANTLQSALKTGHKSLKEIAEDKLIEAEYEELDDDISERELRKL
jgi:hypothetical protein